MEESNPMHATPPLPPDLNTQSSSHTAHTWWKYTTLGLLTLFIAVGLLLTGYFLGQQKSSQLSSVAIASPTPTLIPASPSSTIKKEGVPLTPTTISFTRIDGKTYMRYKGKVYESDEQFGEPTEVTLNENDYTWHGLVNSPIQTPESTYYTDGLFSFKQLPNTDITFVMLWEQPDRTIQSNIFYYDNKTKKVSHPVTITPDQDHRTFFPKVNTASSNGPYVTLDLFRCWGCDGGGYPQTLVLNGKTGVSKNIGQVVEFKWGKNGNYTYKEYVGIPCPTPTGNPGEYQQQECPVDPTTLPLKTGQI